MKYIKYSLLSFIVIISTLIFYINHTNINFSKSYISQAIYEAIGRKIKLNGDLVLTLFPNPGISVNDIQIENIDWSKKEHFVEAKSINVELSLSALLVGKLEITLIKLDGFNVNLERSDTNKKNWVFEIAEEFTAKKEEIEKNINLPINKDTKIIITNIFINYKDDKLNKNLLVNKLDINQNEETNIKFKAIYENESIDIKLQTAELKKIMMLKSIPLKMDGNIGNVNFNIKTAVPVKEDYKNYLYVDFTFKTENISTIKNITKIQFQEYGNIYIKGDIKQHSRNLTLNIDKGLVGDTKINGSFSYVDMETRPKIVSQLNIYALNLQLIQNNTRNEVAIKNVKNKIKKLFSKDSLPFEYLYKYDADIGISLKNIKYDFIELDEMVLQANLKDGLLTVDKLYINNKRNENLNANIRIDARPSIPDFNVELIVNDLLLEKNQILKQYLSGANTHIETNLNSKGQSIQEIMEHLNGQLIVKVGEGKLDDKLLKFISSNILTDLVNAINPIADKSPTTNLECAAIRFDINKGVLIADKGIVMQTDKIQIISSGVIDLHTETLEFGIRPQARKGIEINLNSLATMVKLSGDISEPTITMSLKDTAIVYSYFATGGITYLAKSLYDSVSRDKSPCKTALLSPEKKH